MNHTQCKPPVDNKEFICYSVAMKQNTHNQINTPDAELTLNLDFQKTPFVIAGDTEVLAPLAEAAQAYDARHPAQKFAQTVVRAVEQAPQPTEQYVNLGELDDRTAARLALKCFVRDMKNLGRTNKYREFTEKRRAEQDLAFDMEVGLVTQVHCRLHERMLEKVH